MEIFRKKGEQSLIAQQGSASSEDVTEFSFSQCHVPFARLSEFTKLQKLRMVSMTPQLKDLASFPFCSPSPSPLSSVSAFGLSLRKLDLSDNKLTSLDASVYYLPNLEQLIITNNLFATVASFSDAIKRGSPKLAWLDVALNPVEAELRNAEKELGVSSREGNEGEVDETLALPSSAPTMMGDHYRTVIFTAIPSLAVLDGADRNGCEVDDRDSDSDDGDEGDDSDDGYEEDEEEGEHEEEQEDSRGLEEAPTRKLHRAE